MRSVAMLIGGEPNSKLTDIGLLVLRVWSGLAVALAHGLGKVPPAAGFVGMVEGMGLPAPQLFAWLAALAEFGGGLLLAAGLLTRPAALLLVIHFVIVVLVAHAGDAFGDREPAMFFLFTAFLFLLSGAGRYSVDGTLGKRTR